MERPDCIDNMFLSNPTAADRAQAYGTMKEYILDLEREHRELEDRLSKLSYSLKQIRAIVCETIGFPMPSGSGAT